MTTDSYRTSGPTPSRVPIRLLSTGLLLLLWLASVPPFSAYADHVDLEAASLVVTDLPTGYLPDERDALPSASLGSPVHLRYFVAEPSSEGSDPSVLGVATTEIDMSRGTGRERELLIANLLAYFPGEPVRPRLTDLAFVGPPVAQRTAWAAGVTIDEPPAAVYVVAFEAGEGVGALCAVGLTLDEVVHLARLVADRFRP